MDCSERAGGLLGEGWWTTRRSLVDCSERAGGLLREVWWIARRSLADCSEKSGGLLGEDWWTARKGLFASNYSNKMTVGTSRQKRLVPTAISFPMLMPAAERATP